LFVLMYGDVLSSSSATSRGGGAPYVAYGARTFLVRFVYRPVYDAMCGVVYGTCTAVCTIHRAT
jgi:hypothetical protein